MGAPRAVRGAAWYFLFVGLLLALSPWAHGDSLWVRTGTDGQPEAQPYFFWP